jgi:heptosyltransferase I
MTDGLKILILKPSSLGDVVQAIPVLRLLKSANPAHQVFWWLSSELADLLSGDPDLSGIFLFDRRRWARPRYWGEALQSVGRMRDQHFDWVLDLQALARSSAVAWLARGRLCVGLEDWREGAAAFYDIAVRRASPLTHAIDWYLDVLKVLDVPVHWNFTWIPPRPQAAAQIQQKWNPHGHPWVLLNPGARWTNKRWPAESYAEVVRQLSSEDPKIRFAVLGSSGDAPLGAVIARANPRCCLDLTGKTSLPEVIEWIRLSRLVVTNDTGPMHIAAALGKPVVALFGPTEPRRTGPYQQLERTLRTPLPCVPCLKPRCHYTPPLHCLHSISPSAVCSRARALLAV